MVIILVNSSTIKDLVDIVSFLSSKNYSSYVVRNTIPNKIVLIDTINPIDLKRIQEFSFVERIHDVKCSHQSTSNEVCQHVNIKIGDINVGKDLLIIAGPCSIEDEDTCLRIAESVRLAGANGFRGGVFKPRTSPYSFQGVGINGLKILRKIKDNTDLCIVTEVMSEDQIDLVSEYADVLQVGTRNMHNFKLLQSLGRVDKPIILKRGWAATLDEFLLASEYIIKNGNGKVILCERGIRTFENHVRNTLALATVPAVKKVSCLPIIVDPSHGTGHSYMVKPMSLAAIACGADGLLIEAHIDPSKAWTDKDQSVDIDILSGIISCAKNIYKLIINQ